MLAFGQQQETAAQHPLDKLDRLLRRGRTIRTAKLQSGHETKTAGVNRDPLCVNCGQLAQEQVPSAWGIVMPAPVGEGFYSSPAGYTEGIVGVQTNDGAVWIDVGCRLCAPFELRPHLEGAAMLCPAGPRTPAPTPGAVTVEDSVADGLDYIATWNAGMLMSDDIKIALKAQKKAAAPVFSD